MGRGHERYKRTISLLIIIMIIPIILVVWIYLSSIVTFGFTLSLSVTLVMIAFASSLHLFDRRPSIHIDRFVYYKLDDKESKGLSKIFFTSFIIFLIIISTLNLIGLINRQVFALIIVLVVVAAMILVRLKKVPNYLFLMMILVLAQIQILFLYVSASYVSPIGYDTWRDVIWAEFLRTQKGAYYHAAYPTPLVPILYSILTETTTVQTNISPIILGLVFLNVTVILVYIIARSIGNSDNSLITSLLISAVNPVVMFLSVWFVPQAYSGIFVVILAYLLIKHFNGNASVITRRDSLLALIVTCSLVLGHVLNAIFIIVLILSMMSIGVRGFLNKHKNGIFGYLRRIVFLLLIMTISYVSLTTLLNFIVMGARGIQNTLIDVLLGIRYEENVVVNSDKSLATILIYGPLVAYLTLSHVAWIEEEDFGWIATFINTGYPLAVLIMAVGMLLSTFSPHNYPPRYFMLFPTILLIIMSIRGVDKLCFRHKNVGMVAFVLLIGLLLCSSIIGGVHIEGESVTNVRTIFTISAPIKYSESNVINELLFKLDGQYVLCTDMRASLLSLWRLALGELIETLEQQTRPASILLQGSSVSLKIIQLGGYRTQLKVHNENEILITFGGDEIPLKGLYIHRRGSVHENIMNNISEEELLEILNRQNQKIFDGSIEAFIVD